MALTTVFRGTFFSTSLACAAPRREFLADAVALLNNFFTHPYLEVTNGRPAFAFFNPVFRIVVLDADAEHLKSIAADLHRKNPNLSVQLVNAEPQD